MSQARSTHRPGPLRRAASLAILTTGALLGACHGEPASSTTASNSLGETAGQCAPLRCTGDCDEFDDFGEIVSTGRLDDPNGGLPPRHAPPTVTPAAPLVVRKVRLAPEPDGPERGHYLAPVVPAFRSSADDRVAIVDGALRTVKLEALRDTPLSRQSADLGARIFGPGHALETMVGDKGDVIGSTDGGFLCQEKVENPDTCAAFPLDDCYDLVLVQRIEDDKTVPGHPGVRLKSVPLRVRVSSPKTPEAAIADVTLHPESDWKLSSWMPFVSTGEMLPTADGRFVVARLHGGGAAGGPVLSYALDQEGKYARAATSLVYAYSDAPCDVAAWSAQDAQGHFTSMRPVPAAPYDRRLKTNGVPRYGIAARPLRDAAGHDLVETDVLPGSYPWLDREGNNLFFSTVDPRVLSAKAAGARYPVAREHGGTLQEIVSAPRGFAVVGAWTQGKTVMLDGVVNNEDYGFDADDTHLLELYRSALNHLAVRVNGGSNNGVQSLGLKDANGNDHEIESQENATAMHDGSQPVTPRDVVWNVNRGLASDEIAFDDYLNPNLVLLAEMNAAWKNVDGMVSNGVLLDGFASAGDTFTHTPEKIRLQNAAASAIYALASEGEIDGDARVEPVALGGVRGRGLWLEHGAGVHFTLPDALTLEAQGKSFWISAFVDARDDLEGARQLFALDPSAGNGDPTTVELTDGAVVAIRHGDDVARVDISCLAESWRKRWHHLGVLFEPSGRATVFLDGNPAGFATTRAPVALVGGAVHVGGSPEQGGARGVRGWYDDVRIEIDGQGNPLTRAASVELLCNAARGTTVAVSPSSRLWSRAQVAVAAQERARDVHAAQPPVGDLLLCATDYTQDHGVGVGVVPPGTSAMRDAILREGYPRLVWSDERPDSSDRSFCLTCHVDTARDPGRPPQLGMEALTQGTVIAAEDPRTQPMQPVSYGEHRAQAFGNVPAEWIHARDGRFPSKHLVGPQPILDWVLR